MELGREMHSGHWAAHILHRTGFRKPGRLSSSPLTEVYIRSDQLSAAEALLTASSKVEMDVEQIPCILTKLALPRFDDKAGRPGSRTSRDRILQDQSTGRSRAALKSIPDLGTWIDYEIHRLWVLGDLYIIKGELENAAASLDAAMAECKDGGERPFSYQQGNILRSMGTLHVKQSRADLAIDKFKEAREFHRKAQWVSEQATDLKRLGEAYEMLEMAEEAGAAFRDAEELMESVREARTLKE
ncbi:hypothetical protein BJ912DRAFT_1056011 [Pholiota molesta]|nr:hypothetical protein BJ912DRAFT_1056011 [Pholiota molesta]